LAPELREELPRSSALAATRRRHLGLSVEAGEPIPDAALETVGAERTAGRAGLEWA